MKTAPAGSTAQSVAPATAAAPVAAPPAAPVVVAPVVAPVAPAIPSVSVESLPQLSIPGDSSLVRFPASAQGHRVFFDGRPLVVTGEPMAGYLFGNLPWVKENLDKIIWSAILIPGLLVLFGAWRARRKAALPQT